jgi:hypothetical protein
MLRRSIYTLTRCPASSAMGLATALEPNDTKTTYVYRTSRERIYRLSGEEVVVVVLVIYLVGVDDRANPFNVDSLHRDTGTTLARRALTHSSCSISGAGDPRQ